MHTGAGFKPGVTEAVPCPCRAAVSLWWSCHAWPQFLHTQEIAFCFANPGVTSIGLNSIHFGSPFSFIFKRENKT